MRYSILNASSQMDNLGCREKTRLVKNMKRENGL